MEIAFDDIVVSVNGNVFDSMSDEEFLHFCLDNKLLRIERDENKQIILMAPVHTFTGFAPVCPDFVIELKSKSDNIKYLKNKMQKWVDNGCRLAWLINPDAEEIFIYRGDGTISKVNGFKNVLSGEDVLPGFNLDLSILS